MEESNELLDRPQEFELAAVSSDFVVLIGLYGKVCLRSRKKTFPLKSELTAGGLYKEIL